MRQMSVPETFDPLRIHQYFVPLGRTVVQPHRRRLRVGYASPGAVRTTLQCPRRQIRIIIAEVVQWTVGFLATATRMFEQPRRISDTDGGTREHQPAALGSGTLTSCVDGRPH